MRQGFLGGGIFYWTSVVGIELDKLFQRKAVFLRLQKEAYEHTAMIMNGG